VRFRVHNRFISVIGNLIFFSFFSPFLSAIEHRVGNLIDIEIICLKFGFDSFEW
jgi:hypothetical protein